MSVARAFPVGSVRWAVAVLGDAWGLMFDPPLADTTTPNPVFRAERHDYEIVRRCYTTMDRGTAFDPRVWVGVPLTERRA